MSSNTQPWESYSRPVPTVPAVPPKLPDRPQNGRPY